MASGSIDKIGLINIIDNAFDKYYKKKDPNYESIDTIERNSTIFSFLEKLYAVLKDRSLFNDRDLVEAYREAITGCQTKLRQIENRKIYQYNCNIAGSTSETDVKKMGLIELVKDLWRYADRNFPDNLTENEQKYGYYEVVDGKKVFNGYKENIIISNKLYPRYIDDKVDYSMFDLEVENKNGVKETIKANGSYIKIYGFNGQTKTVEGVRYDAPFAEIYLNGARYGTYNKLEYLIGENGSQGIMQLSVNQLNCLYSQAANPSIMFVEYAFENGFAVNDMNEYESVNGVIYDLFTAALKSLDGATNYLMDYLKEYFYHGIVERYRERKIEDKSTALKMSTLDATYGTNVIPKVYETLSGKGGNIGGVQTIDFDRKVELGLAEYSRITFDESYYVFDTNTIELYINRIYINRLMKQLGSYDDIESYIAQMARRFANNKMSDDYIDYFDETEEINELLLRSMFFAVEPRFQPSDMSKYPFNKRFYMNNVRNFQKVYFYDREAALREDNVLKNLTAAEGSDKSWSTSKRGVNISLRYDRENMIISLHNDKDIVVDTTVFTDDEDMSVKSYLAKLNDKYSNAGRVYLGNGYINIGKVPQKFKDNSVSKLIDNDDTNKNSFFESTEFASLLDDREFAVVHGSRGGLFTRETFENNVVKRERVAEEYSVFVNSGGQYATGVYGIPKTVGTDGKPVTGGDIEVYSEVKMPRWKRATLTRGDRYFELECTEFAKHNDIGSISQIRVMDATNALDRWLFNVRSVEKRKTEYEYKYFEFDIEDLSKYNMTYVLNNVVYFPSKFAIVGGDTLTYLKNTDENAYLSTESIVVDDEVSGKKYDVDSSIVISVPDEMLADKTYVFGDDLIFPSFDESPEVWENIDSRSFELGNNNKTYTLVVDEDEKTERLFEFKYYLILEETYGNSDYYHDQPLEVLIMQFVQMDGRPNRVELPQVGYMIDAGSSKVIATKYKPRKIREYLNPIRVKNDPKIKAYFYRGNTALIHNYMVNGTPNNMTIRPKMARPTINLMKSFKLPSLKILIDRTNRSGRYFLFSKDSYKSNGNFYMKESVRLRYLYEGDEDKYQTKPIGFSQATLSMKESVARFLYGETDLGLDPSDVEKNISAIITQEAIGEEEENFFSLFAYTAFRLFHRKYGYYPPATNQWPYDESMGPDRRESFNTEIQLDEVKVDALLFKEIVDYVDKENKKIYKLDELKLGEGKPERGELNGVKVKIELDNSEGVSFSLNERELES